MFAGVMSAYNLIMSEEINLHFEERLTFPSVVPLWAAEANNSVQGFITLLKQNPHMLFTHVLP